MYQYFLMVLFAITGVSLGSSIKVVRQGDEALVEVFGIYDRKKLEPGITFLVPFVERVAYQETLREQILQLPPQQCKTRDRVPVTVDFIVHWRIIDLEKACYKVQNLKQSLFNIMILAIGTHISQLTLEQLYVDRPQINNALVEDLDTIAEPWGVKFTKVELRNFTTCSKLVESISIDLKELPNLQA